MQVRQEMFGYLRKTKRRKPFLPVRVNYGNALTMRYRHRRARLTPQVALLSGFFGTLLCLAFSENQHSDRAQCRHDERTTQHRLEQGTAGQGNDTAND